MMWNGEKEGELVITGRERREKGVGKGEESWRRPLAKVVGVILLLEPTASTLTLV